VSQEQAFLDSIFETPEDAAPRLIYADWLEERGDERGELLRIRSELPNLRPRDQRRKMLTQRERELTSRCDEDWLVLLERADWKVRYQALEPTGKHRSRWARRRQAAIGAALRGFEAEREMRLPRSYKAFAHVFGPGEIAQYFRICVPCVADDYQDLVTFNRNAQSGEGYYWAGEAERLRRTVFLALTIGGEAVVWDTAAVTEPVGHEYRVCWLDRADDVYRTADSFRQFIDEICLKVFDEEGEKTPQEFLPYGTRWRA
jgi:uncharacterized protein (TIGR02996 family)